MDIKEIELKIEKEKSFIDDCIIEISTFQQVGEYEKVRERLEDMLKSITSCIALQDKLMKLKTRQQFFQAIENLKKSGIQLERVKVDREKILEEVY